MPDDFLARLDALDARDRVGSAPPNEAGNSNALQTVDDIMRRLADGASFGYADKLAARVSTLFSGDYDQALQDERRLTENAGKRLGRGAVVADVAGGIGGGLAGGTLLRGGAALAGRAGMAAPAAAITAADNAGVAGRAAVGAVDGLAQSALDAAGRDKELTRGNMLMSTALGAGLNGGVAALARARVPSSMSPEDARLARVLDQAGVQLTAGQRTGSKPVQWMESVLGDLPFTGAPAQRVAADQGRNFNRAALSEAGRSADELTPQVMTTTKRALGSRIENIANRNQIQFDTQFVRDVRNVAAEYADNLDALQKPIFERLLMGIPQRAPNGVMDGAVYQKLRSTLTRMSKGDGGDTELKNALRGLRNALDDAATRSISPQDAQAWQRARGQYANYKTLETAMNGAGQEVATGNLSPARLRAAVAQRGDYVGENTRLAALARAGERFLKPLPNSGTAPRNYYTSLASGGIGATVGGALGGGLPGAVLGTGAALALPAAASRILFSRPVQRFLGSGAPVGPAGDMPRALLQGAYGGGYMTGTEDRNGAR